MKELNEVSEIAPIQNDNVSKLDLSKPLDFSESENDKGKSYSRWDTPMDFSEDKSTFNKSNQEVHPPFEGEKSNSFAERQNEGFDPDKGVEKKDTADSEKKGLTDEEKEQIKKETGWSDEIINHIDSMEQYEIYKNADLQEAEINGKKCLVKNIDMDYVDPKTGLTNRELMEKGRAPIDAKTGEKIELHHMGQDKDGPFAELCENSEHGDGNHGTLHPKTDGSWRNETGANENYNNERAEHWKTRAQEA